MITKLLADENIDGPIVERLRADGHDVNWVAEVAAGATDEAVLELARSQGRVLLTADHDFGDLVFRLGEATTGVILVRLDGLSPVAKAAVIAQAIREHGSELIGKFVVVAPGSLRIRGA